MIMGCIWSLNQRQTAGAGIGEGLRYRKPRAAISDKPAPHIQSLQSPPHRPKSEPACFLNSSEGFPRTRARWLLLGPVALATVPWTLGGPVRSLRTQDSGLGSAFAICANFVDLVDAA